jgi:hypothetical protein
MITRQAGRGLPATVRVVGRCQVDGMALARAGANKQVLKPQTIIVRTPL